MWDANRRPTSVIIGGPQHQESDHWWPTTSRIGKMLFLPVAGAPALVMDYRSQFTNDDFRAVFGHTEPDGWNLAELAAHTVVSFIAEAIAQITNSGH